MYLFAWRRFIRPLYYPLASHRLLRPGGCFLTVCVIMLSTAVSCPSSLAAEPRVNPAAPNKALVKEVTGAVIKSLGENEQLLDKAVERGIQRYIDRQRAEQDKARAEQARQVQETAKKVRRPSPDRDHIRGNPRATISLIEYSDFECPFCKRFHETPGKLLETHGDQLNWVYRHYPLGFHNPGAQKQAEATECASELGGGDAFWRYTDALYGRTTSGGKGFPVEQLAPLAEELGLNRLDFEKCLESGRYATRVKEDLDEGSAIGITGTPGTILLNNKTGEVRLLSGALPESTLAASIGELLGPAKEKAANHP
jgi:protein-disulfide isomerase